MIEPVTKPSVAARMAAFCLRLYQLTLSPVLHAFLGPGSGCRFEPNCSCYGREALFKHGFIAGCGLALRRVLRCHPWNPGGYDPVPDLKSDNKPGMGTSFKTHF